MYNYLYNNIKLKYTQKNDAFNLIIIITPTEAELNHYIILAFYYLKVLTLRI